MQDYDSKFKDMYEKKIAELKADNARLQADCDGWKKRNKELRETNTAITNKVLEINNQYGELHQELDAAKKANEMHEFNTEQMSKLLRKYLTELGALEFQFNALKEIEETYHDLEKSFNKLLHFLPSEATDREIQHNHALTDIANSLNDLFEKVEEFKKVPNTAKAAAMADIVALARQQLKESRELVYNNVQRANPVATAKKLADAIDKLDKLEALRATEGQAESGGVV